MDPLSIVIVVALGFVVGVLVGITSVGSGALMTPILYLDFANILSHSLVVGTATTQGTITKFAASIRNYFKGRLRTNYAFMIAVTGVPFAVVGAFFSSSFVKFNLFSPLLASVLLLVGILIIVQLRRKRMHHVDDPAMSPKLKRRGMGIGVAIGLIAGLTGVSTGSLLVSSLIVLLKFPNKTAVNIAIFEGGIILLAATLTQIYLGNVDYLFTFLLVIGGVPGILLGNHYKEKVDQKLLGYGIAGVIIFESLRTLSSFFFGKSFFFF